MRYTRKVMRTGEEVLAVGTYHWLYSVVAYLFLFLLGPFVAGIIIFLVMMIRKWTTEIVITTDRLIYKTGWISRQTEEIALARMEEISLVQTVLGRILGYGTLRICGTGINAIDLPHMLSHPLDFRRALAEARESSRRSLVASAAERTSA